MDGTDTSSILYGTACPITGFSFQVALSQKELRMDGKQDSLVIQQCHSRVEWFVPLTEGWHTRSELKKDTRKDIKLKKSVITDNWVGRRLVRIISANQQTLRGEMDSDELIRKCAAISLKSEEENMINFAEKMKAKGQKQQHIASLEKFFIHGESLVKGLEQPCSKFGDRLKE